MNIGYAELERINTISKAQKLQARELNKREVFECSWLCVIILALTLIAGFFN